MRLDDIARVLLAEDVDGDGRVDHRDVAAFDHRQETHREALAFHHAALGEPTDNGVSLLEAFLGDDETLVADTMDALFDGRLSAFEGRDSRARTVNVSLVSFGDGAVATADGRFSYDAEEGHSSARSRIGTYAKGDAPMVIEAFPRRGSLVLGWRGCDSVAADRLSCVIAPNRDRVVEVVFGYETPQVAENFADLTWAESELAADGTLTVHIPAAAQERRADVEGLVVGDHVVASADGGVLRRVEQAARADGADAYVIGTVHANLEDVVEQGTLHVRRSLTEGDLGGTGRRCLLCCSDPGRPAAGRRPGRSRTTRASGCCEPAIRRPGRSWSSSAIRSRPPRTHGVPNRPVSNSKGP